MSARKLSRRDFLRMGAVGTAGIVAAACAPAATPGSAPAGGEQAPAAADIELIHSFWGSPEEWKLWVSFDQQFSREHPGFTITSEHIASDYENQILLRAAAGDLPDVMNVQDEPLPRFADRGVYMNLDPFVERDSAELNLDDFFPKTVEMFMWDREAKQWLQGNHYAMPWDGGEILWFYNIGVFEEAGVEPPANQGWDWTMDEFLDVAKKLVKLDDSGNLERAAFLLPGWVYHMPFIYTMGGRYIDLKNGKGMLSTPESIEAIQFFVDLRLKHHVVPYTAEFQGMGATDLFREGKIAMHLTGPWWFPDLRAIPTEELQFDVLHFPKNPQTGYRATRQSWDGMAIGDGSEHPDAAWEYIKFVLSPEGQTRIAELGRAMPARPSIAKTEAFLNPDLPPEHEEVFIDGLEYAVVQPVTLYWNEMWTIIGKYWELMTLEDVQMPVEEAVVKMDEALNYLFEHGELPAEY